MTSESQRTENRNGISPWQRISYPLILITLAAGFFVGPVKLLGGSYISYVVVDILAVAVLLAVFGERIAARKPLFVASPLSIPFLLFGAFCILELANPEAPFIRSVIGLRSWLLYFGFYFVGLYSLRSVTQLHRLYAILIGFGVLTAMYGVYQWRAGPQSFATWSDYYGQYAAWFYWSARSGAVFRAFSTFVTPAAFSTTMAVLMLVAFSVAISSTIRLPLRLAAFLAFGVMGAGIAASGSRGPVALLLLAGITALVLITGLRRRVVFAVVTVLLGVLAASAVTLLVGSVVRERFTTIFDPQAFFWKWFGSFSNGLQIGWTHPLGMGLGYTAGVPRFINNPAIRELPTMNIDSGYGSAAAELGLLGLGLFAFLALTVGFQSFRTWRSLPGGQVRDLLLGPALLAITYPMVSFVFQPQAALPTSLIEWLLIGILMKGPLLEKKLDASDLPRTKVHTRE